MRCPLYGTRASYKSNLCWSPRAARDKQCLLGARGGQRSWPIGRVFSANGKRDQSGPGGGPFLKLGLGQEASHVWFYLIFKTTAESGGFYCTYLQLKEPELSWSMHHAEHDCWLQSPCPFTCWAQECSLKVSVWIVAFFGLQCLNNHWLG